MAQLAPTAVASARGRPVRLPSLASLCGCRCSFVAPSGAMRVRLSSDAVGSGGVAMSISSAFSNLVVLGKGGRRGKTKRMEAVFACICYRGESVSYPSFYHLVLLAAHRGLCCALLANKGERNGNYGSGRTMTFSSVRCEESGCDGLIELRQAEHTEVVEVNGEDAGVHNLETEIYDFMQKSAKPSNFPSKEELIAAGRTDLVEAIGSQGGWLAYGWDLGDDEASGSGVVDVGKGTRGRAREGELRTDGVDFRFPQTNSIAMQHPETSSSWVDVEIVPQEKSGYTTGSAAGSSPTSSSGRPIEMKGGEESGIEGILNRLEKERNFLYMLDSTNKETINQFSSKPKHLYLGSSGDITIVPNGKANSFGNLNGDPLEECAYPVLQRTSELKSARKEHHPVSIGDQNQIRLRLQDLRSALTSMLVSLISRDDAVVLNKGQEASLKELQRISDAWEFQETEIKSARDKLRSTKAKLTILEGKMTLEIIEAQRKVDAKQKRIEAAQRALHLLQTAYIVWANSASEVLLAGSFDGWSSQRKMERSSTGIFSLYLKLYPGQYEIKFIVDGIWRVDPLRPIVHTNGYENNLLIIL